MMHLLTSPEAWAARVEAHLRRQGMDWSALRHRPLSTLRPEPGPPVRRERAIRSMLDRSPLRDEVGFTRALEAAYRDLWKRWCAGPETTMFTAPPKLRPEDSIQGVLVKTL